MHIGSHAKIRAKWLKISDQFTSAVVVVHHRWCFSARAAVAPTPCLQLRVEDGNECAELHLPARISLEIDALYKRFGFDG
jgi:hypothetical protein